MRFASLTLATALASSLYVPCARASAAQSAQPAAALPTRPDAHLGHALGADFVLPDWNTVRGYFEKLDRESERVLVEKAGTSTEGRDFVVAVISSAQNLAQLDVLKRRAARVTDPRGSSPEELADAVQHGKPFVFISCAMHATECAAPQFAMQFAWELATSDAEPYVSARENCVVILAPSLNPDGLDHVVEWYRRTVNTPYEASELPKLYQLYTGHDNNRDWFMLTQRETRIVTELLYAKWKPQVYWDVHQQGSKKERLFVPPFRDPLDPSLDPAIVCGMNLLGTRGQFDLTRAGLTGVATGVTYDMWWNGGNRNVPVRHNIVGLLTEAASCRLASPLFLPKSELQSPSGAKEYGPSNAFPAPWPGGWWRIADIIAYELAFGRSLLGSVSREPSFWLANQLAASERAVRGEVPGAPFAWIVPSSNADNGATLRLADVLLASGVELHAAPRAFEAEGRTWPVGSLVISARQPYSRHVQSLFEIQRYPAGDPPYDVAGWTLPALLGVEAAEVRGELAAELALERVQTVDEVRTALARGRTDVLALDTHDSDTWKSVFARLGRGEKLDCATQGERAGTFGLANGAATGTSSVSKSSSDEPWRLTKLPRIGLYAPWTGNMDEGWMRWVFDEFGVNYTRVRNETLRPGALRDAFDVLVLPGVSANDLDRGRNPGTVFDELAGGLDPEGAIAIEEFVRAGGRLVAVGNSCSWAIDLCQLPVADVTSGPDAKEFNCPGSVLRTIPEPSRFTPGLAESVAVFGANPKAFRALTQKERETAKAGDGSVDVLLRYAPTRTLISGYIAKPEIIAGQAAWVRARHGAGDVHLFGFRPQYRGWSQAAFQLLFRALLFDERNR